MQNNLGLIISIMPQHLICLSNSKVKTEAPSEVDFKSEQIFSGFNPSHRLQLHETIFDLIWYGAGRWSWDELYSMPIFLRRYWVKRVNAKIDAETENNERQSKQQKSTLKNRRR